MVNVRESEFGEFMDRQAIVDCAIRYTYALDALDWGALDEVFIINATAVLGGDDLNGRDAIVGKCRSALEGLDTIQHIVSNHVVKLDGDTATHRCYLHAQHVRLKVEGGHLYTVGGRYDDELIRTEDGWRIAHRTLTVLWTSGNRKVVRP